MGDARLGNGCEKLAIATREDLVAWTRDLLPDPFACVDRSGATYGPAIRELEYVSRPLWAVFSLIASGEYDETMVEPYIRRIKAGLDQDGPLAFPVPTVKTRQILVEMGVYGFGLMSCGERLLRYFDDRERVALASWLGNINEIDLPWGNWYLFRIMVNSGLRSCGMPYDAERLAQDCRAVESMYAGGGWYEDGMPFQRDYYVALTFHAASMLVSHFVPEVELSYDEERERAFEDDFVCWFDRQGRSLPFGRSLSYRFAHVAFWAVAALTGVHVRPLSQLKWLLLSNLSWWHDKPMMDGDHLSVGYAYPNMQLGEDYTGPGAPAWAFRAMMALTLPSDHEFWRVEPEPPQLPERRVEQGPGMLLQTGERHTCAFPVMQYSAGKVLQRMSKYGKLCYSTAFGWNVTRDVEGIGNFAADSTLALSLARTDQYVSRTRIESFRLEEGYAYCLWSCRTLARVETWLVPVDELRHVRVHRIEAAYPLETYEGGFPVMGWNGKFDTPVQGEGTLGMRRMLCDGRVVESGIADAVSTVAEQVEVALRHAGLGSLLYEMQWTPRATEVVSQCPNTNIYDWERNAVPALRGSLPTGTSCVACLVYGNPDVTPDEPPFCKGR